VASRRSGDQALYHSEHILLKTRCALLAWFCFELLLTITLTCNGFRSLFAAACMRACQHAASVMNDNSSRFGKYLELTFDDEGAIRGASMSHYLLEKSRVTVRNDKEQTFHIFYQVYAGLAASNALSEHFLSKPSSNSYVFALFLVAFVAKMPLAAA
jgi:hypothetical protein